MLVKIYWADEKSSGWKVLVEDDHSITEQIQTVFEINLKIQKVIIYIIFFLELTPVIATISNKNP